MNSKVFRKLLLGSAALVYGTIGAAELAHAQLDEVVVTATKREKSIQDIPVSVTAISADSLQNEAVTNLDSLQYSVPGLSMTTASGAGFQSSLRIRGVGTSGTNLGFEGAVGIFIDGIFRPRAGTSLGDLTDVERVEVLRGPQGTLFGRNTTAGAISVITKKPVMDETSSSVRLTGGNLGRTQFQGVYNTPLGDKSAGRISLDYYERDGILDNVVAGVDDSNDRDRTSLRGQVLYEPNADMQIRVIANYFSTDENCCGAIIFNDHEFNLAATFQRPDPSTDRDDFETARDFKTIEEQEEIGGQVDFTWTLANGITFFNSVSYSDYETDGQTDADQTAIDFTRNTINRILQKQFTEEFRFSGVMDELSSVQSVNWILGGYYSEETLGQIYRLEFGEDTNAIDDTYIGLEMLTAPLPPTDPNRVFWRALGFGLTNGDNHFATLAQDAEVWALFAHFDIAINDRWSASFGTRYTSEDKTGSGVFETGRGANNNLINPFASVGARDFEADSDADEWITNVSVTAQLNDDASIYASYADGYKSGGLNLDVLGGQAGALPGTSRATASCLSAGTPEQIASCVVAGTTLDPTFPVETVDTYELGLKSRLMDNRVTLNVTAFNSVFENFQLLQFTGTSFNVVSIPEVETSGFEAEAQINPTEGLNIGVQYTLAEAEYTKPFLLGATQLNGETLNNAPEHSVGITATYTRDFANTNLKGMAFIGLAYESEYNASAGLEATREQDDFTLVSGRLGVYSQDDKYGLELWCRNCANEDVAQIVFTSPVLDGREFAFPSPPREVGLTLTARF